MFPKVSDAKFKEVIFVGPQNSELMQVMREWMAVRVRQWVDLSVSERPEREPVQASGLLWSLIEAGYDYLSCEPTHSVAECQLYQE
jgi:hypothetical protein